MNKYECFYNGKRDTIEADTTYQAQQKFAEKHKVPAKRRYQITVMLAEKDGKTNYIDPASL